MKHISMLVFVGLFVWTATTAVAGVLFQDNFDSYSDSPKNHGWGWVGDQVTLNSTSGRNGSHGIVVRYNKNGFPGEHALTKDLASYNGQEIFVRLYFKVGPNPTRGSKFLKFFGAPASDGKSANTTFALKYESTKLEEISYGDGTSTSNDTQTTIKYDGNITNWSADPLVVLKKQNGVFNPQDGQWHCFEVRMKYNSNNQRDGAYQVWIDGTLWIDASNVKNRHNSNPFFSHFNLGDYSAQPTTDWSIYYDDVVVSTSYIGPKGTTSSPPDEVTTPDTPPTDAPTIPKAVAGLREE